MVLKLWGKYGVEKKRLLQSHLLEDDVCVPAADPLDGGHGKHDVALPVNVGVHDTQDVLEVGRDDQRHFGQEGELEKNET